MHLRNIKRYEQKYTMNFNKLLGWQYKVSKTTLAIRFSLLHVCPISRAIFTRPSFNVLSSYFYVSFKQTT